MKKTLLLFSAVLLSALSLPAANVAWVSFHAGDNTPSANALAVGFTQAPDVGYTSLLSANGYNVTRVVTRDDLAVTNASFLNAFDLVVISRSVPSGHFQQALETAAWNGLTTKVLDMGGYTMRANRLGWTTGDTIPDTTNSLVTLKPVAYHPIFSGIPIDGSTGNMFNGFANRQSFNAYGTNVILQSGISVNTNPLDGGGQVLATVGNAGDPAFGGTIIALWNKGSVVNGGTEVLGGYRMAFLSGSRESGITSEAAGIYDLTADGAKLFLNSVNYMITVVPEPSTVALLALGSLALLIRRRLA